VAGTFMLGETKVRPGSYFNIQRKGSNATAGILNGITAVIFRADFGPLNEAVELSVEDGYEGIFGIGLTTDALREAFAGGAKTIIACRVGNGGRQGTITLKDKDDMEAVTITAKYPGDKDFTVTIREKLSDSSLKECIVYTGTTQFEKLEFAAGVGEVKALVEAFATSKNFKAEAKEREDEKIVANVLQSVFTKGTNPEVTSGDYSNAFAQVEPFEYNTICVDTEETSIHMLLQSFINRIFDAGSLTQAVIAEKQSVDLETRIMHAASFNDEKINYVLNAKVDEQGVIIDGYQTAARIAGMIGACASNSSLTHTVINGFSELKESLSNTDMIAAEKKGCIVLSYNKSKQVWIDNAINTLITPADNQDDGWKKIRRVKTRFELIRRINNTADDLVGKVDNDTNGRQTVISQLQGVGDDMKAEGKLVACTVTESSAYLSDGDSAWFDIDVIDKDSMEHIYLTFTFRFSTREE
jgi:Phage tail sheath protein.